MGEQTTTARLRVSIVALALCLSSGTGFADDLRIEGAGEGLDIVQALCAAFMADHPNTYVVIPPSTRSDGGVSAVMTDKVVLGRVARPLSLAEQAHGLLYTPVFRLASAIYVNPSVTITNLSTTQLADIFTGRIVNWGEIGTYSKILEPRVRILIIDGRHPSDADYPSAVTIGFIHKNATITDQAKAFLALPKAKALVTNMGGIPLPE